MVGKEYAYCVCLCSFICAEAKLYVIAKINEVSLKFQEGLKERWTFKGTANIGKTDKRAVDSYDIIGSAKFGSYTISATRRRRNFRLHVMLHAVHRRSREGVVAQG